MEHLSEALSTISTSPSSLKICCDISTQSKSCPPPFHCDFLINIAWSWVLIFVSVCCPVATVKSRGRRGGKKKFPQQSQQKKSGSAFGNKFCMRFQVWLSSVCISVEKVCVVFFSLTLLGATLVHCKEWFICFKNCECVQTLLKLMTLFFFFKLLTSSQVKSELVSFYILFCGFSKRFKTPALPSVS